MTAIATAEVSIAAPGAEVWRALTDPEVIKQYMFGSQVETDWRPGSPIVWKGEFEGRSYEDKGEVLDVVPEQRIKVTHFSPMTGLPDARAVRRFDNRAAHSGQRGERRRDRALVAELAADARRAQGRRRGLTPGGAQIARVPLGSTR